MKQILLILAIVMASLSASADAYNYLNFVKADAATGNSFATPLKITFNGTNATVTSGGTSTTVSMGNFSYLEFSNTQLEGGETTTYAKGDVNGDGEIDITDVNILINIVLGKDDASNYGGRAYVTGDDVIDISDVNSTISIMLGAS